VTRRSGAGAWRSSGLILGWIYLVFGGFAFILVMVVEIASSSG